MLNKIKVLNLYVGIGGNRKLWENVDVTAVEIVPEIAKIYQDFFPDDKVIITDAHQYLLEHYNEFDFIWSSPPCPTHSVTNHFLFAQGNIRYPDMSLWQEIVFLQKWFKGKWVVENVESYYPPLWKPKFLDRHYFWSSFYISDFIVERDFNICKARASTRKNQEEDINELENYHGIKLPTVAKNKRLLLRNCVYPPLGLHILNCATLKDYYKQEVLI
jgi:DNA (cytosine-5)-methyltransferase 1